MSWLAILSTSVKLNWTHKHQYLNLRNLDMKGVAWKGQVGRFHGRPSTKQIAFEQIWKRINILLPDLYQEE